MGMMSGMGSAMGSGWMAAAMLGNVLLGLGLLALVMVGAVAGIREEFVRLRENLA